MLFFGEVLKLKEKINDDSINKNETNHFKNHHSGETVKNREF